MKTYIVLGLCLVLMATSTLAELPKPENPRWKPIVDEVYLQEIPSQIATETPLTAVAVYKDTAYLGDAQGVLQLDNGALKRLDGPKSAVAEMKVLNGMLWAATAKGLWAYDGSTWAGIGEKPIVDMCYYRDTIYAISGKEILKIEGNDLVSVAEGRSNLGGIDVYSETIFVHTPTMENWDHMYQAEVKIGCLEMGELTFSYMADWGHTQPGSEFRDMLPQGSKLLFASNKGISVLRGMTWYHIKGEDGLCVEDTTCLSEGFAEDLWIGSKRGVMRYVDGKYDYFGQQRYLPNDQVNAIAVGDSTVYIATEGGLAMIDFVPYTLEKKAAYYERFMEEWGMKRLGFTHSLVKRGEEWERHISDNDVGYSSHYMSALCFKYAITKDPKVREQALDMMKSVKWSEEINPMDGFVARSIWVVDDVGDKARHGSGGLPAEWHPTPDGKFEWKGDTSSDETDAHIYETALFLELVATEDSPERAMALEHMDKLVSYIIDCGWRLYDYDGKPTRWARWDPDYLFTPYGSYAKGLNGMEALNYVTTAYALTGNEKFKEGKEQLLEWGYHKNTLRQKLTFHPGYFTPFDDRLAFYNYFELIRYEDDPDLKSIWLRSLERSWEVKRIDGLPWFNFIYGALTGNDCENERSVAYLRESPLDLVSYSYRNAHRDDIHVPEGYTMYSERVKPLSARVAGVQRWDSNFMNLNGGAGGNAASEAGGWLDAYWMGRYFGMIEAPTTTDPDLLTVPKRDLQFGAKPYDGPERPKLRYELK